MSPITPFHCSLSHRDYCLQHRCRTSLGKTRGIRLVPGQIGKICAALAANLDVAIRGLRLTYRRAFTVIVSGGPATLVARPAHFRVTTLRWCRPLLSNKQPSVTRGQVQRVADVAASQVHAIQALGEFFDETHSHVRAKARDVPATKYRSGSLSNINVGSRRHISESLPPECGDNYLPNK